jgi:hypothetical protein
MQLARGESSGYRVAAIQSCVGLMLFGNNFFPWYFSETEDMRFPFLKFEAFN